MSVLIESRIHALETGITWQRQDVQARVKKVMRSVGPSKVDWETTASLDGGAEQGFLFLHVLPMGNGEM